MADPNLDFDPAFGEPLNRFIAAANAQGIKTKVISGRRTAEDGQQLWANYQAGKAGQALPYPDRGPVPLAAPPGTSLHERGLAADVEAADPSQQSALWALAPKFGLTALGMKDPNHFQIGAVPPPDATASSSAPTAPPAPAPINPGLTVNSSPLAGSHSQFITDYAKSIGLDPNLALGIANAEGLKAWSAKNPNAASSVDVENGKPFSFGDFQLNIHPGAVGAKALAAGIDPSDPSQWQAADRFALDQMKAGGVGPWKGDAVAAAYLRSGAVPGGQPAAAPPATPGTTLNSSPAPFSGAQQTQLAQNLKKALGVPDDNQGQGQDQVRPSPMIQGPGARGVSPLLGNPDLYRQRMAGLNQPMQWAGGSPGQMAGSGYGAQAQPSVYGTSLMSQLQMLDNPLYMNQMAGGGFG